MIEFWFGLIARTLSTRCRVRARPPASSYGNACAGLALILCLTTGCRVRDRATVVILNGSEPETIDPQICTGQPDGRVAAALFEGLTRFNAETGTAEPGIAHSWEISKDGKIYTFHLRTNAAWSTGDPIRAEDVVYSWRRAVNPVTGVDYVGQLFYVKNGEFLNTNRSAPDFATLGVRALDPLTVEVELENPTPFFIDLCAFRTLSVVPRQTIEPLGKESDQWIRSKVLPCSGAYQLEEWRLNDRIRLRRNPHYWDATNVRAETIDVLPTESPTATLNLYFSGQADFIVDNRSIPTELNDILRARPDFHSFTYLGVYFMRINVTRAPFNDVRVRQAMAMAIQKQRLVERITRMGEPIATALVPSNCGGYEPPAGLLFNPEEAKRLLAEAGYPGGQGFPVIQYMFNAGGGGGSRLHEQIGVEMQQMLREHLGIQLQLRPVEWKSYLNEQSHTNYDLCRSSWIGDYNDPNTFLDLFLSTSLNNRTGWSNPEYDRLMKQGNATLDRQNRFALLKQAETLLVRDELPIIPLYHYRGLFAFDTNRLGGIYGNLTDEHPFGAIYRKENSSALRR